MNRFILRLATLASPLLLGGCVAVWGSAYEVQSQTPDAMVVDYDTHFIDDSDIEKLAMTIARKPARRRCSNRMM